jgi:hypothetical protein
MPAAAPGPASIRVGLMEARWLSPPRKQSVMHDQSHFTVSGSSSESPERSVPPGEGSPEQRACSRRRLKNQLIIEIAEGTPVELWAAKNGVARRTAFRWAKDPSVRKQVERHRRRILDAAVGRMTRAITKATSGMLKLASGASSESVRLAAQRAVFSDMMAISKFGGLEDRMTTIEGRLDADTGNSCGTR